MTTPSHTHSNTGQLRARQVGDAQAAPPQQLATPTNAARVGTEIDRQVEQIRWLMRREPMLEGREMRTAESLSR